jgi:hypothetical protein
MIETDHTPKVDPVSRAPKLAPLSKVRFAHFDEVKGYATRERAVKRGEEVAGALSDLSFQWVVVALPNGRFAPCVVVNSTVPGGPGRFLGLRNVCLVN